MSSLTEAQTAQLLKDCASEPIHRPGSIQPRGLLLAFGADGRVEHASANAAKLLGWKSPSSRADELPSVLLGLCAAELQAGCSLSLPFLDLAVREEHPSFLTALQVEDRNYQVVMHRNGPSKTIVELEEVPTGWGGTGQQGHQSDLYGLVSTFVGRLAPLTSQEQLAQLAVDEIRDLTGFDRVLIYRFETNWDGRVLAESRNTELPSYLGLRFPASDIPEQARRLYTLNRLRSIPDANYVPVPIESLRGTEPLDLTYSVLRSVAPVHLEYMRNMGTMASMSISVLRDGALWGLISCHNKLPRSVPFLSRIACDIIAQVLSSQLAAADHRELAELRIQLKSRQARLLTLIAAEESFLGGLRLHSDVLMACTNAAGSAVISEGKCLLAGCTPSEEEVRELAGALSGVASPDAVVSTDCLSDLHPPALAYSDKAAGLIAFRFLPSRELHHVVSARTAGNGILGRRPAEARAGAGRHRAPSAAVV